MSGEIIKQRRNELGLTLEEVGKKVGVGKSTVRKWENGMIENMRRDNIVALSKALGISPIDILGVDVQEDIFSIYTQLEHKRKQKVYNYAENQLEEQNKGKFLYNFGTTAAGSAIEYADGFVEEEELKYIPAKADYVLTVKGESMEPEIPNGSKVFVESTPSVENGEIAIVEVGGDGVTCKRIRYDFENEKVVLESLNPEYEDMVFENKQIRILGRVVK